MPPPRAPRNAASAVLALLLGLGVAAFVHGPHAPPVYDGIAAPPSPYRWESPPSNLRAGNQPPLSGTATLAISKGQVASGSVVTGDSQAAFYVVAGALTAPAGATSVKCTLAPNPNPPTPPAGVNIRGNVYRFTCVGQPGGAPVTVASSFRLTLRFPPGAFKEIQYDDGTRWRPLQTTRDPGGNPYAGVTGIALGDYAATAPVGAPGDSIVSVLGRYVEFYGILAFVIIFGVIAVIQEIRRRRHRAPAPEKKRGR
jgi:hypothetical protein